MTLVRVGKEVTRDDEEPTKVVSLQEAFEAFQPSIKFEGRAGEHEPVFKAEFRFRSLTDFDPNNLLKRQQIKNADGQLEYLPNELSGLKNHIDLLYRLQKRWASPAVRQAWADPNRRREIVVALDGVRSQLERLLSDSLARPLLEEVFADFPALFDQSVTHFLTQLLHIEDSYEQTVSTLQAQIDTAESMLDQLLAQLFEQLRPIERSYRQVMLFIENSKVPDGKVRPATELYIFNGDSRAIRRPAESLSIAAIERFVTMRNDNFDFRDDICNLVVPGFVPQPVREKFEDIANARGMLLIGDTDDEKSFHNVDRQLASGAKYDFLTRPEHRGATHVVLTGYLELREAHSFESKIDGGDGLFAPPSMAFAGAVARADAQGGLAQGPIGPRFGQIVGVEKSRFEPLISETELLSMERQLIPIIRDADNHLCFYGCRTQAYDPDGVLKFFTSYRIIRYIERRCRHYLLQVAGQTLTRHFMDDQIDSPIRKMLDEQVEQGAIMSYDLDVDKSSEKRRRGICDIFISITPTGPAETFILLKLDVPDFQAENIAVDLDPQDEERRPTDETFVPSRPIDPNTRKQ